MFTDLASDSALQVIYKNLVLVKFWYSSVKEYPQVSEHVLKTLLLSPEETLALFTLTPPGSP